MELSEIITNEVQEELLDLQITGIEYGASFQVSHVKAFLSQPHH